MKLNQKSLFASLALGTALVVSATSGAQAAVTITIAESGANVVATGSGSINLTALTISSGGTASPIVAGNLGGLFVGAPADFSAHSGFTGPATFGSGSAFFANTGIGDMFGVRGNIGQLYVPSGYVSQAPLSGTATWNGQTISGLGLTPGTYVYNWGTGPTADSLTVQIVPEPSHALLLLGGLGTLALRRRR